MNVIHLKGIITQDRQLQLTLPNDIPTGEVDVTIYPTLSMEDTTLPATMPSKSATGADIVAMMEKENLWWDLEIEDGLSWVEAQRHYLLKQP